MKNKFFFLFLINCHICFAAQDIESLSKMAIMTQDTTYARSLFNQALDLKKAQKYDDAFIKMDSARIIFESDPLTNYKVVLKTYLELGRLKANLQAFNEAISYYNKAVELGYANKDSLNFDLGIALHNIGASYYTLGDLQSAFENYDRCLEVFKFYNTKESQQKIAEAYYNQALVLDDAGEFEMGLENKTLCLTLRTELNEDSIIIAKTLFSIGESYDLLNKPAEALKYKMNALNICDHRHDKSSYEYGLFNKGIGSTFRDLGQYDEAIFHLNLALDIYRNKFGDISIPSATVYNSLGLLQEGKEDFNRALEYKLKAMAIFEAILPPSHYNLAISYNNVGNTYTSLKKNTEAIYYFKLAEKIFEKNFEANRFTLGHLYNNLSILFLNQLKIDEAFSTVYQAMDIFKENNMFLEYVNALNNLGNIFVVNSDFDSAITTFNKCEILYSNLGINNLYKWDIYNSLGECYLSLNKLDSAVYFFSKSVAGINNFPNRNIIKETVKTEFTALYQLIKIHILKYEISNDSQALNNIPEYIHESKKLIAYHKAYQYLYKYNPDWEERYKILNEQLIKYYQIIVPKNNLSSFAISESSKSDILHKSIHAQNAINFANIPNDKIKEEIKLKQKINQLEKEYINVYLDKQLNSDSNHVLLPSSIFDLKLSYDSLIQTFEKDYPEYYRLKYNIKNISMEDTQQKLLQKGQTMLEYFVGDSSIFIFVVRSDTFDVVQVKKDFPLDSLVRKMQSGLYGYYGLAKEQRKDEIFKKSLNDFSEASFNIYQRIIAPVQHLLTPDLVIIPDGVLGYVPFEALLKSKPEKLNQFGSYPYLINDHTISYNYSATLWNEMKSKKHKKEPSKSLVAFAPFYEGSYTVLDSTINLVFDTLSDGRDTTIFQDVVSRKTYSPLPSSGIEAGTVSKMWKGDYYINNDATEQKFYDVAGEYRFVHLSTHGVADARQGDYSYLAFAEQKDSIENEFLYVRDIYNTQLNADLVFLSACETAQGELQRGEGIISLARAFAYAGAKSIITTLWQVDDEATKDISIDFYKNLKKGFTKDVALRQAKLRHIKSAKSTQKHPFFWAAMIGIGDMGVVK